MQNYFAFDAKKYNMEAFFGDMRTFKEQYEVPASISHILFHFIVDVIVALLLPL